MKKTYTFLVLALLAISSLALCADKHFPKIKVLGQVSTRSANTTFFSRVIDKEVSWTNGLIIKSQPRYKHKLATDTKILIGSYTITLYPGALIKIDKNSIIPLLGRIDIQKANKGEDGLFFKTSKFSCEFLEGRIIIEICPNGDSYLVSPKQVKAWLKEISRKVHVLEAGTELFFPAFGITKVKNIISSRWSQSPAGYANIESSITKIQRKIITASKSASLASINSDKQNHRIASDTQVNLSIPEGNKKRSPKTKDSAKHQETKK